MIEKFPQIQLFKAYSPDEAKAYRIKLALKIKQALE